MESATVEKVSDLVTKNSGFTYRLVQLKIEGEYSRVVEVKAARKASSFAGQLIVGKTVTLIYPGEQTPDKGVLLFITPESRPDMGRYWPEIRCYKIYFNKEKK